jgi:hypothetical protein
VGAKRRPPTTDIPPRVVNITGTFFDKLQAQTFVRIGKDGAVWLWQCECGETCERSLHSVRGRKNRGTPNACDKCSPPTIVTNRWLGKKNGRGLDPNRMNRNGRTSISTRDADEIFRPRLPNRKLCWVLVKDGHVLARAGGANELHAMRRIVGGAIDTERAA